MVFGWALSSCLCPRRWLVSTILAPRKTSILLPRTEIRQMSNLLREPKILDAYRTYSRLNISNCWTRGNFGRGLCGKTSAVRSPCVNALKPPHIPDRWIPERTTCGRRQDAAQDRHSTRPQSTHSSSFVPALYSGITHHRPLRRC